MDEKSKRNSVLPGSQPVKDRAGIQIHNYLADFQRPHLLSPYSTIFQFCNLDCLSIPKALNCCLNIFILDTRLAVVIQFHSPPLRYPLQIRGRDNVSKEQLTPRKKTPEVIDTNHAARNHLKNPNKHCLYFRIKQKSQ